MPHTFLVSPFAPFFRMVLLAFALMVATGNALAMTIFVQGQSFSTLTLTVEGSDSIQNIKAKIRDAVHLPTAQQSLAYGSISLQDNRTLADYNITANSTLVLRYCTPTAGYSTCAMFFHTGADQTFTVPAGVTAVNAKVWGAGGGSGGDSHIGGMGGGGGFSRANVSVTPTTALTIKVAGGGQRPVGIAGGSAGFGGGGAGGACSTTCTGAGGGGGGASSVVGPSSTPLLVAGGGAGGGSEVNLAGGAGGGASGIAGVNVTFSGTQYFGGGGGTASSGGVGATGTLATGMSGSSLQGGGGAGGTSSGSGGGGGGYFGGGGGGGSDSNISGNISTGGGGGSGYCAPTGVSVCALEAGSAVSPAGSTDPHYVDGTGTGGGVNAAGSNGLVVLQWHPSPIVVTNEAELREAIFAISNDATLAGSTVSLANSITLTKTLPMIRNSVTFAGNGFTIDANNSGRVFMVVSGTTTVGNLTILNAKAVGGAGGGGVNSGVGAGGGGLGAGAAVFVYTGATANLSNVSVNGASAVGGAGGSGMDAVSGSGGGGGGGLGGAGGAAHSAGYDTGGGGGGYMGNGGAAGLESNGGGGGEFGNGGIGSLYMYYAGGGGGGQQGHGGSPPNGPSAGVGGGRGMYTSGSVGDGAPLGGGGGGTGDGSVGRGGVAGGGGGSGYGTGGVGGLGGGGGGSSAEIERIGGAGGDFGGGGGGFTGGAGGFGGGGGGSPPRNNRYVGGAGGFGGGGGGSFVIGQGGAYGGTGAANTGIVGGAGGGGGGALGGAFFVAQGGTLTINGLTNSSLTGTFDVTGGAAGSGGTTPATAGQAQGKALFVYGTGTTTLEVSSGQTVTLSGEKAIAGTGTLTKTGAGKLLFTAAIGDAGNSNFSGSLNINAGSLGGTITIDGTTTIANGAAVAPGASAGTLSLNNLVLNNTSALDFELGNPAGTAGTDSDLISVSGNLTLDGIVNVSALTNFGTGTYRLINYTGTLIDNTLTVGSMPAGYAGSISVDTVNKRVDLVVTNTHTVIGTASPLAGGSVVCTPSPVSHGGTSSCTATANAGYTFSAFSGSCSGASCNLINIQSNKTVTALFTADTPPAATDPIAPFDSLPPLLGIGSRPPILNLSAGLGPDMVRCLTESVRSILGAGFNFLGQLSDGSARYGDGNTTVAFYPLVASTNNTQPVGMRLLGNNFLNIATSCGNFNITAAMHNLAEFGQLLNATGQLVAHINAQGVLSVNVNGTLYVFRPNYLVSPGAGSGSPTLAMGPDGLFRFTDSAGNVQILYPAFADPDVLSVQIAQAVSGTTQIQPDGTALVRVLSGQQYELTPDLTLGEVAPEFRSLGWWQDGPKHYRYRLASFPDRSQGFTIKDKP